MRKKPLIGEEGYFRKVFDTHQMRPSMIWEELMMKSRCSALIKILKDKDGNVLELFSGHTTWSDYSELLKFYK